MLSRSVCPSVRTGVRHVHAFVETNTDIFKNVLPPGSHIIHIFPYQTLWQYSDRGPTNWSKKRDFRQISGFCIDHCWTVACRQHFNGGVSVIALKRRSLLLAGDGRRTAMHHLILFMTESLNVTPRQQNSI